MQLQQVTPFWFGVEAAKQSTNNNREPKLLKGLVCSSQATPLEKVKRSGQFFRVPSVESCPSLLTALTLSRAASVFTKSRFSSSLLATMWDKGWCLGDSCLGEQSRLLPGALSWLASASAHLALLCENARRGRNWPPVSVRSEPRSVGLGTREVSAAPAAASRGVLGKGQWGRCGSSRRSAHGSGALLSCRQTESSLWPPQHPGV